MNHAFRLVIPISILVASTASAQSLGDVARKEEARRKAVQGSGKIYTNENLHPEPPPATPAATDATQPAPAASTTSTPKTADDAKKTADDGKKPASDTDKKDEPKKDEAYWKQRLTTEREALDRAQSFADALQSRINALATEFTNRDDPAQRGRIATDRQKALAELDRVKQEIQQHTKAIADVQEEGRRAGLPAGWLR
jgi:hypothetical protein